MIKPFNDMVKLDISCHIEQKPNFVWDKKAGVYVEKGSFSYLNWAKAIILLYEHGAESVNYKPLKNEAGHSLFMNPSLLADGLSGCPEVRVWVKVDDKDGEFNYPIARGASIVAKEKMTQLDIHVCQQRALVKGIAILTGLGLNLWAKEDFDTYASSEMPVEELAEIEETKNKKIDKVKLATIEAECLRTGTKKKQITKTFEIETLEELNIEQFAQAMSFFEKLPNVEPKQQLSL